MTAASNMHCRNKQKGLWACKPQLTEVEARNRAGAADIPQGRGWQRRGRAELTELLAAVDLDYLLDRHGMHATVDWGAILSSVRAFDLQSTLDRKQEVVNAC